MPMRGNALQAKYMGPYLVEKRMSELVYAVIAPDRRKSKQICLINHSMTKNQMLLVTKMTKVKENQNRMK